MRILIVDDTSHIRRALKRALRGHEVREAADPVEARQHYGWAELVISDWDMGQHTGAQVIEESPVQVIVFSSHYVEHATVVAKPGIGALLELIKELASERQLVWGAA